MKKTFFLLLQSFIIVTILLTTSTQSFSQEVQIRYARGFQIEQRHNFTLVTVKNPWPGAGNKFTYLLKARGGKTPSGFPDCQVVEVPVQRVIGLSTTFLAFFEQLQVLDRLVGFSDLSRVHSPLIRDAAGINPILEVGQGSNLQMENVLDLEPEIIFTFATGNFRDTHPKLLEAGLKVGIVGEYMESHPLGRSEWIKFFALFFNRSREAEEIFSALETRYQQLAKMTTSVQHRPTVVTGIPFSGRWYIAGGKSFIATFLHDAGANYLWQQTSFSGARPMDIELVYERALNADFWLNTGAWSSLAQAKRADPRFLEFSALKTGQLYNNNRRINIEGGNDYWESGIMAPDIVLADLIYIFHPRLLPNHKPFYYTHLK